MQRSAMQRGHDGGLGTQLVGERITVNGREVDVTKLLGEGGFSYVYLVKDLSDGAPPALQQASQGSDGTSATKTSGSRSSSQTSSSSNLVLKITSIHSRQQRDVAEKEAKLLSRLSHPSIIRMYDSCYRTATSPHSGGGLVAGVLGGGHSHSHADSNRKERPQHLILMEYCEGGHALDVCTQLMAEGKHFDLGELVIAFGQICNAVSYLHAQRPPIIHRDLKPVNFLVKNGAYKLCDFGSAVFGHVELKTAKQRSEAEEVIQKTTTQMFRAPEMVDLYMTKKLTQSTDVWALGCCLYSLAFLQNCFEEGSNLAILSRKFKIPENNPYGDGIVELIDRMLTVDCKARVDMTEVILCLSAIFSGRPLPPRKKSKSSSKKRENKEGGAAKDGEQKVGSYRTDGQGIKTPNKQVVEPKRPVEAKKLNPNSAAARRRRVAGASSPHNSQSNKLRPLTSSTGGASDLNTSFFPDSSFGFQGNASDMNEEDLAFSTTSNPFASTNWEGDENKTSGSNILKTSVGNNVFEDNGFWSNPQSSGSISGADPVFPPFGESGEVGVEVTLAPTPERHERNRSRRVHANSDGVEGREASDPTLDFATRVPNRMRPSPSKKDAAWPTVDASQSRKKNTGWQVNSMFPTR